MIVSVNWLKKFTSIDLPIDQLITLIGARLVEVEKVINIGDKYKDVLIAKVIECSPVPESDHLNLCRIDDGGKAESVDRDSDGMIQVVCGAPNVRAGLTVAWLPPGSIVPETSGSDEPFMLGSRKLRGHMSNGMIASAKELDLWDEHDGILEIDIESKPGSSFAEVYELDDYLLDIENKSLTHRPDCFGLIGLAREVSAIQGNKFISPDWYLALEPIISEKTADLAEPTIKIQDTSICSRYEAVVLSNVDTRVESPLIIKSYLSRSGMRPISAAVDITNYLMLITGQPLHAFDYDKLCKVSTTGSADIVVRNASNEEKMILLDNREITMTDNDIVVCAGDKPVALAGAMGGIETEIDNNTQNIMIESATFDLYSLRNTQFRHGIFSEAITRFTKGQPAALTAPVLASAVRMFVGMTNAKIASKIVDSSVSHSNTDSFRISTDDVNNLLGSDYDDEVIINTLTNLEYSNVEQTTDQINACAPWWRTDLHIIEDVVEDIGRVNGYDNINPTLPMRSFTAIRPADVAIIKDRIRSSLSSVGSNEVLTYSFIHGDLLKKVGQDPNNSYRITNAISPNLQYYRQSLLPSLLEAASSNLDAGFDQFSLFEINKVHQKSLELNYEQVPLESNNLAMVFVDRHAKGALYYSAKASLEYLFSILNVIPEYKRLDEANFLNSSFEPKRSSIVLNKSTGRVLGVVGEFRNSVRRSLKIDCSTSGFELDIDALLEVSIGQSTYEPIGRYPSAKRDVTFQVDFKLPYGQIESLVEETLRQSGLQFSMTPLSIYQGDDKSNKNISFRLKLASYSRTLSGEETAAIMTRLTDIVTRELNAKVI